MERLGDLVHPAVNAGHRVVHHRLPGDAAHLSDNEASALPVEHLGGS